MLKTIKVSVILILATIAALVLQRLGIREENILMIYVVGVLVVIIETYSYLWGTIAAVVFVLTFSYLFADPKYNFKIHDANYFVSFAIFMVVTSIVATLVTRLQNQIKIVEYNEYITCKLYKISNGFLNLIEEEEIIDYSEKCLYEITKREIKIYIKPKEEKFKGSPLWWCYTYSAPCGRDEDNFSDLNYKYVPIKNNYRTLGVAVLECRQSKITKEEMLYINTILSQMTIALDRNWLNKLEEENKLKIEKEKLKNNLLRSISHDLRTPLTGIKGGASFLYESLEELDTESVKDILDNISSEATWLGNLVENLLNMTRIQDGRLSIKNNKEVVDDIILEATSRVSKRIKDHTLNIKTPDDVMLVPMDGQLIIQVLVNLIDNAIIHTKTDSDIEVKAYKEDDSLIFEVSDNGGGIPNNKLDKIFESFFTTSNDIGDKQRGMGLGLSICKSIIEAHEGKISAYNNENNGATFRIVLPLKGVAYE